MGLMFHKIYVKEYFMKKKTFFLVLVVFSIAFVLATVGCTKESKLVGRWVLLSAESGNWINTIVLSKDGTGVLNGPITWKIENDRLYLLDPNGGFVPEYEYSISGSELHLKSSRGNQAIYTKQN